MTAVLSLCLSSLSLSILYTIMFSSHVGEKVWLSVEDSLHRVAPLGTQMRSVASTIHDSTICLPATSSYGPPTLSESQGLSEAASSGTATDSCSIIEDSRLAEADKDYTLWRDELSVGDLIDACDRNHEWFQVQCEHPPPTYYASSALDE